MAENFAVKIAAAASEGLDKDRGLWYEYKPTAEHYIKEKHFRVQAEEMIGFFNAWQLSSNKHWLGKFLQSWKYIGSSIKDQLYGEWYWGRKENETIIEGQDEAGIWKCPYQNSRACMEIIRRIAASAV